MSNKKLLDFRNFFNDKRIKRLKIKSCQSGRCPRHRKILLGVSNFDPTPYHYDPGPLRSRTITSTNRNGSQTKTIRPRYVTLWDCYSAGQTRSGLATLTIINSLLARVVTTQERFVSCCTCHGWRAYLLGWNTLRPHHMTRCHSRPFAL